MNDPSHVLDKVRRALGRTGPVTAPPAPPPIDETVARLVYADLGLPELFAKRAAEMKMDVSALYADDLSEQLVAFLKEHGIKRIAMSAGGLLEKLNVRGALEAAGFAVNTWDEITLDGLYDGYDCGITDAAYAVAETGSVVIRPTPAHGRALSLVPWFHVVVLEPKNFVGDLLDLMDRLHKDGCASAHLVMITGPSKTADIEMNVVVGVHGPNHVKAFVLQ